MNRIYTIVLVFCLFFTGCAAPQVIEKSITSEVTRILEQTVIVTQLVTTTPGPTQTAKIVVVTATSTPTLLATATPTNTPSPTNTPKPTTDPLTADRGAGFYLTGVDIAPGVWRNDGNSDGCYWAVTSKTGDILDNHFGMGGGTAYINPAGYQVEFSSDCGRWTYLGQ